MPKAGVRFLTANSAKHNKNDDKTSLPQVHNSHKKPKENRKHIQHTQYKQIQQEIVQSDNKSSNTSSDQVHTSVSASQLPNQSYGNQSPVEVSGHTSIKPPSKSQTSVTKHSFLASSEQLTNFNPPLLLVSQAASQVHTTKSSQSLNTPTSSQADTLPSQADVITSSESDGLTFVEPLSTTSPSNFGESLPSRGHTSVNPTNRSSSYQIQTSNLPRNRKSCSSMSSNSPRSPKPYDSMSSSDCKTPTNSTEISSKSITPMSGEAELSAGYLPALSPTDRVEELAGFVRRMKLQQEVNGVCDDSTTNESGNHHCPIIWRTRSLNAPSPIQQFGPCGRIMRNSAMVMTIQDPASQRLTWYKPPLSVLVIKKVRDATVIPPFLHLVTWLTQEQRMVVFVEASVLSDRLVTGHAMFPLVKDKLMSFRETHDDLTDKIDFIICLGGDGTLLYASSLFQQSVPPVMAFHLGSLGFLTPFKFDNFQEQVTNVLEGHAALTLRSRLRCIILRRGQEKQPPGGGKSSNGGGDGGMKAPTNLLVLNEVVIDRGPSSYLSNLDLYLDGKRITSVQGDGLIVSTPTGSTAYAVAAGASMIHPSVPAIMVTPICPHSLSFRPIVVPAGVELKIAVSAESRNTAWVSFDGRMRQELRQEDSLRVTTSIYPVPSICAEDQIADWFASLDECLRWNDRKRQRHLDDPPPPLPPPSACDGNVKETEGTEGQQEESGEDGQEGERVADETIATTAMMKVPAEKKQQIKVVNKAELHSVPESGEEEEAVEEEEEEEEDEDEEEEDEDEVERHGQHT